MIKRPWGIHTIDDMYSSNVQTTDSQGRPVLAVAEPYACNPIQRIRAAWWVLTNRAQAVVWPSAGDIDVHVKWTFKQLEWDEFSKQPFKLISDQHLIAMNGDGRYWLHHRIHGDLRGSDGRVKFYNSLSGAKAAAQTDFEHRTKAAFINGE